MAPAPAALAARSEPPAPPSPRPPPASRRRQPPAGVPAPLAIGPRESAAEAGLRAQLGRARAGRRGRSPLARSAVRPRRGAWRGRGCALWPGPARRGSGVAGGAGARGRVLEPGPGAAWRGPGGTAQLQAPAMEPGRVENLSVVYQSRDFLVVNKHWDLRIDSRMWRETPTLQKQLRHHFPELADPDTYYGFRFCHQLDFSTSGALCVALNKAAAGSAYKCFKERRVTKAYLALVRGHVQESRMTINYAIGRNSTEGRAHTMCIEGTEGCENPKPSLTELVVLEHGLYAGDPVSKVLLQPLTGRTHQLRVHCSALSHPVVGDLTYGQASDQEDQPFRMMLHAFYLRIPTHSECVEACTPDPFVPALDACWSPHTLVQSLDQLVQVLRAAPDPDPTEGCPVPCSTPTPPSKPPETEAQQASCLQWLSEWTLEPDH
uniref:Pseudouridine synthase RsuA/RluA-like domain-containing protein n=1 Tax=Canis lupus familiaris TaxID=9615 RepID=A0A8C0NC74_CANLF